ncbi:hypothetical protein I4U23_001332 [Adineta vaga]|nr:hypothetical protein I4U23_001332 [Adineta vaga]
MDTNPENNVSKSIVVHSEDRVALPPAEALIHTSDEIKIESSPVQTARTYSFSLNEMCRLYFQCTIILVCIWYTASVGFNLYLQKLFNRNQHTEDIYSLVCLTAFIQNLTCFFGVILSYFISKLKIYQLSSKEVSLKIEKEKRCWIVFIVAGLFHCLGIMITNYLLSLSNISCVHTIRALEPLIASILIYFIPIPNQTNSNWKTTIFEKLFGIILMISGVILSTSRSGQCQFLSTLIYLGLLTNFLWVIRNICIQYIRIHMNEIFTQMIIYGISTIISFSLMIIHRFPSLLLENHWNLLIFIGLLSLIYNSTSIIVCNRVNLVSHSLLTMLKRPILIIVSLIYFDHHLNVMIILGTILILLGLSFYKMNLSQQLSIFHEKFYVITLFTIILIASSSYLFHLNTHHSLQMKTIRMRKDFPLYYWTPDSKNDNFGDTLSYILVRSIVGPQLAFINTKDRRSYCKKSKLLAIGSIFQFACKHDVIWGSGILNPTKFPFFNNSRLINTIDIRAVRGPRTRNALIAKYNIDVPEIYGDPALLLPFYLKSYKKSVKSIIPILLILHYKDAKQRRIHSELKKIVTVDAFLPWEILLKMILQSEFVISTSLHGLIVSEAFGIQARFLKSSLINVFQFHDYYEGTNRPLEFATTIDEAIAMGGQQLPKINLTKLLNAFPFDKFA